MHPPDTAHGLMFHHFHDGNMHIPSQGSMTGEEFGRVLDRYAKRYDLLSAPDWFKKAVSGELRDAQVCVTFDDTLRAQFDIAFPVLEARGLKAFWFVYTAPLKGDAVPMELYRYYRYKYFDTVDSFYRAFYDGAKDDPAGEKIARGLAHFPVDFLGTYPAYSTEDRKFRYIRDVALERAEYERIMDGLLARAGVPVELIRKTLWMNKDHIRALNRAGHIVGLHSHTHPTLFAALSAEEQKKEYERNASCLRELIGKPAESMSHPSNSYTNDTLAILRDLGIRIGFRATPERQKHTALEYPRFDGRFLISETRHANPAPKATL